MFIILPLWFLDNTMLFLEQKHQAYYMLSTVTFIL